MATGYGFARNIRLIGVKGCGISTGLHEALAKEGHGCVRPPAFCNHPAKVFFQRTRANRGVRAIPMVIMSNSNKRKTDMSATETDGDRAAHARHAGPSFADPSKWVKQAETFARREPVKAVASAVGAGFLMNLLPIRAILGALIAIVFVLARPLLLFLGLLKAWEMCPCKKEPKV